MRREIEAVTKTGIGEQDMLSARNRAGAEAGVMGTGRATSTRL